jgi:hypothetical protein
VLADVSAKLLDQFVANLESSVLAPVDTDADLQQDASESEVTKVPRVDHEVPLSEDGSPGEVRRIDSVPAEPVDLVEFAGSSLARRLVKPAIISVALMALAIRVAHRRRPH